MEIIECLLRDHERMKAKVARIMSETNVSLRESAFEELYDLIESHTEAEETVVFHRALKDPSLRSSALEGIERHIMHEMLLTRTRYTEDREMREARMKVVCDLLVHHLDRKEREFLPKLADRFQSEDREAMAEEFANIRERETDRDEFEAEFSRPLAEARI